MANFKVPNLCGASPEFNAIQTKFESMITSALDGLETDAAALKATLDSEVNALVGDLKTMIPELPALPDINLQAELTSLTGLDIGSGEHNALLADITSKFGNALTTGGFSLDSLVSDAASLLGGGGSLCSGVPNFTVPAAGGDAVQKAVGVLQAAADAEEEQPSTLNNNSNIASAKSAIETAASKWINPDIETVPTISIGNFNVTSKSRTITSGGTNKSITSTAIDRRGGVRRDQGRPNTIDGSSETVPKKVATPKDAVDGTKRANTSVDGFSTQLTGTEELHTASDIRKVSPSPALIKYANENDVPQWGVDRDVLDLKHSPRRVHQILGYDAEIDNIVEFGKDSKAVAELGPKGNFIVIPNHTNMAEDFTGQERRAFTAEVVLVYVKNHGMNLFSWRGAIDPAIGPDINQKRYGANTVSVVPANSRFSACPTTYPNKRYHGIVYIVRYDYFDTFDPNYKK